MLQETPKTIAVLLCTYRRPVDLLRCLASLRGQERPPDEILIVVRPEDASTREALTADVLRDLPVRVLPVLAPGLVAARNVGLDNCRSDILAMTDDDTVPHPDWLAMIFGHFKADPSLAGVGGRDRCVNLEGGWSDQRKESVGIISFFGRMSGYHHLGFGPPRRVHLLKGANMSYRMAAVGSLRANTRLRGRGAQAHEDAQFGTALRRRGGSLLYDPAVLVDHYEAPRDEARHYGGICPVSDPEAFKEGPYNWVLTLAEELSPARHVLFLVWNLLVGTRVAPGLVQAVRFTPNLGRAAWYRFWLTQVATLEAYRSLLRERHGVRTNC